MVLTPLVLTGRVSDHIQPYLLQPDVLLEPETAKALSQLSLSAQKAGFQPKIVSGFRSFDRQCRIWNRKFQGLLPIRDRLGQIIPHVLAEKERILAILAWSAIPGASRHHWGTDIDLIDESQLLPGQRYELLPEEFSAGGPFFDFYVWMKRYADHFGFFYPYSKDTGGIMPEPWHISYQSKAQFCENALSIDVVRNCLQEEGLGIEGIAYLLGDLEKFYRLCRSSVA
jgi:LAS superfamily LD-carboxypeptidase LdcB